MSSSFPGRDASTLVTAGDLIAGKYRADRLLGEGGMGMVWAATNKVTHKSVALKFLKSGAQSEDGRRRFLREARAASSVRHPNVVEVYDVIELEDGTPVMILELLSGESLGTRLDRDNALSLPETAHVLLPVISAVGTAHAQGIVHRDLKPDNIFLCGQADGSSTIKVLDFGIAKVTRLDTNATQSLGLTGTGEVLGTPSYMAPEQVFGEKDLDHRADIWALGVILYQCLSGVLPTQGTNVGQVLKIIVTGSIRPITDVVPDIPADIASLVTRMLTRDREARPWDLHDVSAVLGRHAHITIPSFPPTGRRSDSGSADSQSEIHPATAPTAVNPLGPTTADSGLEVHVVRKTVAQRRRRLRLLALGGAALAIVIAAAGWMTRSNAAAHLAPSATESTPIGTQEVPILQSSQSASASTSASPPSSPADASAHLASGPSKTLHRPATQPVASGKAATDNSPKTADPPAQGNTTPIHERVPF